MGMAESTAVRQSDPRETFDAIPEVISEADLISKHVDPGKSVRALHLSLVKSFRSKKVNASRSLVAVGAIRCESTNVSTEL